MILTLICDLSSVSFGWNGLIKFKSSFCTLLGSFNIPIHKSTHAHRQHDQISSIFLKETRDMSWNVSQFNPMYWETAEHSGDLVAMHP